MGIYAADTNVSSEKSKGEIESTLRRYGADQFMSGWKDGQAAVQFRIKNKLVRFVLPLPDANADEYTKGGCIRANYHPEDPRSPAHSRGCFAARPPEVSARLWEQACRQRWRALALAIKAKLEAVACGITSFEEEFMAHIIIPGSHGKTVGDLMLVKLEESYASGKPLALDWGGPPVNDIFTELEKKPDGPGPWRKIKTVNGIRWCSLADGWHGEPWSLAAWRLAQLKAPAKLKKRPAIAGRIKGCLHAGAAEQVLPMSAMLAVGFGGVDVRVGKVTLWGGDDMNYRVRRVETLAAKHPRLDWTITMDTNNELGLGPTDWIMLGSRNIVGCVDGRMASIDIAPDKKPSKKTRKGRAEKKP